MEVENAFSDRGKPRYEPHGGATQDEESRNLVHTGDRADSIYDKRRCCF